MLLRDELSLSIGASPARASPKSSTSTKEDELTKLGFRVILFLTTRVLSILVQVFTDLTWLSSSEFFLQSQFFSTCLRSFFFRNLDLEFHLIRTNKHFLFVQKKLRKKLLERKKSFWAEKHPNWALLHKEFNKQNRLIILGILLGSRKGQKLTQPGQNSKKTLWAEPDDDTTWA